VSPSAPAPRCSCPSAPPCAGRRATTCSTPARTTPAGCTTTSSSASVRCCCSDGHAKESAMDDRTPRSRSRSLPAGLVLAALLAATPGAAGDAPPFAARTGLELASAAAQAWSPDAQLVYVENDDALDAGGASVRWGYLFYSRSEDRARVWSVRGGRIAAAENLDMRFDAPPVAPGWLDSGPPPAPPAPGA